MLRLILVLAAWLAGCGGPVVPEVKFIFTDPGAHDVQREFVLPRDVDLDGAYTAVVAVYARLMVSIEESQTKDGPQFRLINGKMVNMSVADGLNYADCGERQEVKMREKLRWFWEGDDWEIVRSAKAPVAARTVAFNMLLLRAEDGVVMRIETSFSAREGRGCSSRGSFEKMFHSAVLDELATL